LRGSLWRGRKESLSFMLTRFTDRRMIKVTFVSRRLRILVLPVCVDPLLSCSQFHGASSVPTETLLAAKFHSGFAIGRPIVTL